MSALLLVGRWEKWVSFSGIERRVVIVDDSRTIQAMLDNAFSRRADFRVVGFASDGTSAVEIIRRLMPDVVTIDLSMPYIDGAALLGMISDLPRVCKIIVSDKSMSNILLTAKLLEAGASACLRKSDLANDPDGFFRKINAAIEAAGKGKRTPPGASRAAPAKLQHDQPLHVERAIAFPVPVDEAAPLAFVRRKGLNNASPERQFDLITKHVATVTGFPACLLTVIDRETQWLKSAYGVEAGSGPRDQAICNYTIAQGEPFVVSNCSTDERFARHPLVIGAPHLKTYVGHPVVSRDGVRVAALCVIDTRVRTVSRPMLDQLAGMAEIVAELIDQRPALAA